MKTLENFDFGRQVSRSQYDWESILNGKVNVLEKGKDFDCKPVTLKARARAVAKKLGLSVRTGTDKEGNVILQSYEAKDETEFDRAKKEAAPRKRKQPAA